MSTALVLTHFVMASTTVCDTGACSWWGIEIDDGHAVQCCRVDRQTTNAGDYGPPVPSKTVHGRRAGALGLGKQTKPRFKTAPEGACKDIAVLERIAMKLREHEGAIPAGTEARFDVSWPKSALGFTARTSNASLSDSFDGVALTLPPPETFAGSCTAHVTFVANAPQWPQLPPTPTPGELNALALGGAVIANLTYADGALRADLVREAKSRRIVIGSCEQLYDEVRRQAQASLHGRQSTLSVAFGLVAFDGKAIIDLEKDYCARAARQPGVSSSEAVSLLSFVGPALSFETTRRVKEPGQKRRQTWQWQTRDVRSGLPVHVRELVDEAQLVEALRNDETVRAVLGGDVPRSASLDDILAHLDPRFSEDGSAFAVHAFDRRSNKVELRLAFHQRACGDCADRVSQIQVLVSPRAELGEFFERKQGWQGVHGFFRSDVDVQRRVH